MPRSSRLALPTLLAPAAAAAPATAQHLTAAMAAPITTIDPHVYISAPNNGLALHVFDAQKFIIRLHQLMNFWASKKSIAYTPRMDERTVAMNARTTR